MSLLGTPGGDIKLVGYILPPETTAVVAAGDGEEEDDEEPEESQPEFLDMSEILAGGHVLRASAPSYDEVNFQDISGQRLRHKVSGQFALQSPWWEVTCIVRRWHEGKLKVQRRYPSYKLRSDLDREGWRSMVSLFLTACMSGVDMPEHAQFFEWLPRHRDVTFFNLMEILGEFEQGGNVGAAQGLRGRITHSAAGMQVHAAPLYPLVMTYLPTLLPRHFLELLTKGKPRVKPSHPQPATPSTQATAASPAAQNGNGQEMDTVSQEEDLSLLNQLEQILRTGDVWKLGFKFVMNKELQLTGCEAQLQAFIDCDLLDDIPLLQRNALQVYDTLKQHCCNTGSTYMELSRAPCRALLSSPELYTPPPGSFTPSLCDKLRTRMADKATCEAVQFLKEIGVVVRVQGKVALENFHRYEKDISRCLCSLMEGEPWIIPLNAREVLRAAAVERRALKMQALNAECAVADRRDESGKLDGNPVSVTLPHDEKTSLAKSEPSLPPIELDEDQVRAAEMICANAVTVISGKGGCGKTTVVSEVLKAALLQLTEEINQACADFENDTAGEAQGSLLLQLTEEINQACADFENDTAGEAQGSLSRLEGGVQDQEMVEEKGKKLVHGENEILLTAPTGRAASLLTKKTCFTAYTLHQVKSSFQCTKKNEDLKNWRFKSVRVLVVDEGSLVCVQLLCDVLLMLTDHAQLKKFIFLGDVRQLPSIQPGNTLFDLFQSLLPSCAIELRTNHRAESELIVRNAALIACMGMNKTYRQLEFDAIVDLKGPHGPKMASADKSFIHIRLPTTSQDSVDDVKSAVKLLIDSAPGLKDDGTSQFIAFKRSDVELINELCCKHYNNHKTKDLNKKLLFQPGDKVCCTRNGYVHHNEDPRGDPEKKEGDRVRLCNGEIFSITEDVTKCDEGSSREKRYLTLDDGDGRVITADFRELQRECRLQHAWARTIHTFQGSENETIVYVLGDSYYGNWKLMYTAVTRGQKRVYVVAKQEAIKSTIKRRETPRMTQLRCLVNLPQSRAEGADIPSPVTTPRRSEGADIPSPVTTPRGSEGADIPSLVTTPRRSEGADISSPVATPRGSEGADIPSPVTTPRGSEGADIPSPVTTPRGSTATGLIHIPSNPLSSQTPVSTEKQSGPLRALSLDASGVVDDEQLGRVRPAMSQDSPRNKRQLSDVTIGSPSKQIKTELQTGPSPLGCCALQQLSLNTPKSHIKQFPKRHKLFE